MRIEKLHLENIGVFDILDLEFKPCEQQKAEIHIFTGINGSGKSTLLYALAAALTGPLRQTEYLSLIFKRFRHNHAFVEVLFEGKQVINYAATKPQKQSYFTDLSLTAEKKNAGPIFHAYANSSMSNDIDEFVYNFLGNTFAAFAYSGNRSLYSLSELRTDKSVVEILDYDALSFFETANSERVLQSIAIQKMKQAIELSQNNIEQAEQYNLVIQEIEKAMFEIIGWNIEFKLATKPFNIFLEVDGKHLEFDVLPDGLKSILSLIADLIRRLDKLDDNSNILEHHFLLFLDEIDIHLHPAWQRKILPVIQKLFPNAQIFVSTHSPFVVGSVSDAYVYTFKLTDNSVSVLDKIEESKAGNSYSLILEEIFGVEETFDDETEAEFRQFYQLRDEIMQGDDDKITEWLQIARHLMKKGIEVTDIVGMEVRQMSRILKRELSI